jgi:hypothetical protein
MKLTSQSKNLMNFFLENNIQHSSKITEKTKDIFIELYNDIFDAYDFLKKFKKKSSNAFYSFEMQKIISSKQILKPKQFNSNSFPEMVRQHIDEMSSVQLTYHFSLFDRKITIHFVLENDNINENINENAREYNNYIDSIIMWLHILNKYSSPNCSKSLTIYFYMTSLKKTLPDSNIVVLDEINVNTAFTYTCRKDSEIVIYRKEEWFKVFLHETFHNFGLDFSDMNNELCKYKLLSIFDVNSDVNLYEAYSEFWAEIMNILFCSFHMLKNKRNINDFVLFSVKLIQIEKTYSFFQMVKALQFMGLSYKDLYSTTNKSTLLSHSIYKEDTNILAYFVVKTILLNNYEGFFQWCRNNNDSLLQFKKTIENQDKFCKFISNNYKSKQMLENVKSTENLMKSIVNGKKRQIHHDFLLMNMRMTLCELG